MDGEAIAERESFVMRKRLRKKLQKREFDILIVLVAFRMNQMSVEERNNLLDRFIEIAIEENGLQFGGGGSSNIWSGFAEPYEKTLKIDRRQLESLKEWLSQQETISECFVGTPMKGNEIESLMDSDADYPASCLGNSS